MLKLFGLVGAASIQAWLSTLNFRVASAGPWQHPPDPRQNRFIYAFWHESLLAPAVIKTHVHVLISQHADGELIAQVCRHLGLGVVRGSTNRGGSQALLELLRRSQQSHLAITPDGPRGPRRKVQLGTIFLASRTGLSVVPIGVGYTRVWRANSWDRFACPFPASTITGVVGHPLAVPPQLDRAALERFRAELENRLLQATAAAQSWADRLRRSR